MNVNRVETREQAEQAALASGYVRSPNHIYHDRITGQPLPSEWYAGGSGLPQDASGLVLIDGGNPAGRNQDTWPVSLWGHVYGEGCALFLRSRFPSWADYLEHCRNQEVLSPAGLPPYLFGD